MYRKRIDVTYVIRTLGGVMRVARRFGVSHPAVSVWMKNNSIPVRHAEVLALQYGIDCDWFHDPWGCSPKMTEEETVRVLEGRDPDDEHGDMFNYDDPVNWDEETD